MSMNGAKASWLGSMEHKAIPVVFGIGIGINDIVAVQLLRHSVWKMRPSLHHESIGACIRQTISKARRGKQL